jgi:hypothetical protein
MQQNTDTAPSHPTTKKRGLQGAEPDIPGLLAIIIAYLVWRNASSLLCTDISRWRKVQPPPLSCRSHSHQIACLGNLARFLLPLPLYPQMRSLVGGSKKVAFEMLLGRGPQNARVRFSRNGVNSQDASGLLRGAPQIKLYEA